jgi:hypothetical protein
MLARAKGALVMIAVALTAVLVVSLLPDLEAVRSARGTAMAVSVLLLSLPLADSAMFGSTVRPETAGVVLGVPMGFLLRQSQEAPALAAGAGRVAVCALVVSMVLAGVRVYRFRQRA